MGGGAKKSKGAVQGEGGVYIEFLSKGGGGGGGGGAHPLHHPPGSSPGGGDWVEQSLPPYIDVSTYVTLTGQLVQCVLIVLLLPAHSCPIAVLQTLIPNEAT